MNILGILFWDRIEKWNLLSEDKNFRYAGVNPCFTGDMRLLTDKGYVRFDELVNKGDIKIVNVDGNITNSKVWCSGIKDVIALKLSDKRIITCTPEHRFMTIDGNECEAKDMKGKKIMPITKSNVKLNETYIKLGVMQGDGQLHDLTKSETLCLNIGNKDSDIYELFRNDDIKNNSNQRSINVKGYKQLMQDLGFSLTTLGERIFPTTFDKWDITEKASFLCGCYSANGSVISDKGVGYKTTCREFAEKLTNVLKEYFDINAYITTNKSKEVEFPNGIYTVKESYDVNIREYFSIIKFATNINFYHQYKRYKLEKLLKERALTVINIEENGQAKVYDFTEPERHWGVVEGCIVHNCAELRLSCK